LAGKTTKYLNNFTYYQLFIYLHEHQKVLVTGWVASPLPHRLICTPKVIIIFVYWRRRQYERHIWTVEVENETKLVCYIRYKKLLDYNSQIWGGKVTYYSTEP